MPNKTPLPKIRWIPTSNESVREPWNRGRRLDMAMPMSDWANVSLSGRRLPGVCPFDRNVSVGEVRLLSPKITPHIERPVYIAVFRQWDERHVLIAPFSPYLIPATTTELLFAHRHATLRVLCLWNVVTVRPKDLARSWYIDRLSDDDLSDGWHVFRHAITGSSLREEMIARVGAAIRHASDLRIAYQEDEVKVLANLSFAGMG